MWCIAISSTLVTNVEILKRVKVGEINHFSKIILMFLKNPFFQKGFRKVELIFEEFRKFSKKKIEIFFLRKFREISSDYLLEKPMKTKLKH